MTKSDRRESLTPMVREYSETKARLEMASNEVVEAEAQLLSKREAFNSLLLDLAEIQSNINDFSLVK